MKESWPERNLAESVPKLSEAELKLYNLIIPSKRERSLKMEGFSNLYTEAAIKQDREKLERTKALIEAQSNGSAQEKNAHMRGELFEGIVLDQIEDSNWLGETASVIIPSEYDDIENGVDLIIEFSDETGQSHLALAADITKSSLKIDEKLGAIKRNIDTGELTRVKYFENQNFRGELLNVPRVIIGADQNTIREVIDLLLRFKVRQKNPSAGKSGEFKEVREKLETHRLQFMLLLEMRKQLDAFATYADKQPGKEVIAQKYRQSASIISDLLDKKDQDEVYSETNPDLENDKVYGLIMEKASQF